MMSLTEADAEKRPTMDIVISKLKETVTNEPKSTSPTQPRLTEQQVDEIKAESSAYMSAPTPSANVKAQSLQETATKTNEQSSYMVAPTQHTTEKNVPDYSKSPKST
jgi:hypothetical protein